MGGGLLPVYRGREIIGHCPNPDPFFTTDTRPRPHGFFMFKVRQIAKIERAIYSGQDKDHYAIGIIWEHKEARRAKDNRKKK